MLRFAHAGYCDAIRAIMGRNQLSTLKERPLMLAFCRAARCLRNEVGLQPKVLVFCQSLRPENTRSDSGLKEGGLRHPPFGTQGDCHPFVRVNSHDPPTLLCYGSSALYAFLDHARAREGAILPEDLQDKIGASQMNQPEEARDAEQVRLALTWFVAAAAQGDSEAQSKLGMLYERLKDYAQARRWYENAAAQGNSYAQYCLGMLYYNGLGMLPDYTQAPAGSRKQLRRAIATPSIALGCCTTTA